VPGEEAEDLFDVEERLQALRRDAGVFLVHVPRLRD